MFARRLPATCVDAPTTIGSWRRSLRPEPRPARLPVEGQVDNEPAGTRTDIVLDCSDENYRTPGPARRRGRAGHWESDLYARCAAARDVIRPGAEKPAPARTDQVHRRLEGSSTARREGRAHARELSRRLGCRVDFGRRSVQRRDKEDHEA